MSVKWVQVLFPIKYTTPRHFCEAVTHCGKVILSTGPPNILWQRSNRSSLIFIPTGSIFYRLSNHNSRLSSWIYTVMYGWYLHKYHASVVWVKCEIMKPNAKITLEFSSNQRCKIMSSNCMSFSQNIYIINALLLLLLMILNMCSVIRHI